MVDFNKRLAGKKAEKPVDPIKLYDTLDRAHDKGPLRPAQFAILKDWSENYAATRDVVLKLHTGQGKTLLGLLMLQSRLNNGKGPALYLCPDNFLIAQTCEQARQFGIATCTADSDLPDEFLSGDKILVASVQKLFNGLTKFGINNNSEHAGTVLMDDAHACADRIRDACRIRIPHDETAYSALRTLFSHELEQQGFGTFADLINGKRDALLPVPYWAWIGREGEVANILSSHSDKRSIRFVWPIIKDALTNCQCMFSGAAVEIEPYLPPLEAFGTYSNASSRIFMSATVTDDAFLVKGLQLSPDTIAKPLTYSKERWSGEKMVLLPSLIHEDLDRAKMVHAFATKKKKNFGVVGLTPSFARSKDWKEYGAILAGADTVEEIITSLKESVYDNAIVLANRYDGIDLPDNACRILVFDSKPYSENLTDIYQESCRPNSAATLMRTVRTVEQGMGRSVRGEKDYSIIVIIGSDLVRLVRDKKSRKFLSSQAATQIEIGLEIAELAKQEVADGEKPYKAFVNLVNQCLKRDDGWKAFHAEKINNVKPSSANKALLQAYEAELEAEKLYVSGDYTSATNTLQKLIDEGDIPPDDIGWYLQDMARFSYETDRRESQRLQVAAHKRNRLLLKPSSGVTVAKLKVVSLNRIEAIHKWVRDFDTYVELDVALSDILSKLTLGTRADPFEHALDELSRALGFAGERPDKEWKEGPDNLWALDDTNYIIWECKSEVLSDRAEINNSEAEQMSRSAAWFEKHYPGVNVSRILIHPTNTVGTAAAFTYETLIMRGRELKRLVNAVRAFYKSFEALDFRSLSVHHTQKLLDAHKLSVSDMLASYGKKPKILRRR